MNFKIRLATQSDVDAIAQLYDNLNDYLASHTNYPGWVKGVYPTRQDAEGGINQGNLFVALEDGEIVASMILQHEPESAYLSVEWEADLDYQQVFIICTFAVKADKLNCGIGKKMLEFVEQYAKDNNIKSIRLDVTETNTPAMKLYEKCGYHYIDTVSLGLESYGLNWFKLYEKLI